MDDKKKGVVGEVGEAGETGDLGSNAWIQQKQTRPEYPPTDPEKSLVTVNGKKV